MVFSKKDDTKRAIKMFKVRMELAKQAGNMPEANRVKAKIDKALKNG